MPFYNLPLDHENKRLSDDTDDSVSVGSSPPSSPYPNVSGNSYDASVRSESPAFSVFSVISSMRAQAFKQEFGRGINNYSEVYKLPADDEELERLDKQYLIFKEVLGNYPPPMLEIMADVPGETKACLDLGCGSGSWIIDVARNFAHCQTVAVDLVPMQSVDMPRNCRSEVDDINLGLEHFCGDFNVVYSRLVSTGVKDFRNLIDQISRVLRPRGLIIIVEWDFHVYDDRHQRVDIGTHELNGPWWARWVAFAEVATRDIGGCVDAGDKMESWVTNHPAFEEPACEDFWIPTSHWAQHDEFLMRIGATMRDDICSFLSSGRPLLLGSGIPEAVVDELQNNATKEVENAAARQYIRMRCLYARKKKG